MSADLLERARSAVTVEEEALVIFEAVQHSALPVEQRRELCLIVMMAGKEVPRPVLLGVVAALVPEGARYTVDSDSGVILRRHGKGYIVPLTDAATPALRLTIAILEATGHDR